MTQTSEPTEPSVVRPDRRTLLTTAAVGGGAAVAGPLLWTQPGAAAVQPRGVHLAYGMRPHKEVTLSWSTPGSVADPVVDIGKTTAYGRTIRPESTSSLGVPTVYHHARIADLTGGTRYHYRIRHRGATVKVGTFRTAPKAVKAFRFTAFGDMGVNGNAAAHVNLIRRQDPAFAFVVGDLCYADSGGQGKSTDRQQDFTLWDSWLQQIQPSAQSIPWMTAVGNHEMENGNGTLGYAGYFNRFRNPRNGAEGGRATYSFTYGNVGFIALDANDASYEYTRNRNYLGNRQDAWLVQRLTSMRSRDHIDFVVVGFHHCAYCTNVAHGSDAGIRERWGAIFDRFKVDMVVNGHNHCYERTHLVRGGVPVQEARRGAVVDTSKGTVYMTAGGAGQTAYPDFGVPLSSVVVEGGLRVPELAHWRAVGTARHSIAFLDATPPNRSGVATLKLRTLATNGDVIDTLTMTRRR